MIILRSCNELLRRLSRAEDTVFCGRVFIFLFQSFPLGDRSSVNLRGEFHTENVTTFDELPKAQEGSETPMDLDAPEKEITTDTKTESAQVTEQQPSGQAVHGAADEGQQGSKPATKKAHEPEPSSAPSMDDLYPIFWSLQTNFSSPTTLFDPANFAAFKAGLEASLSTFQKVNTDMEVRMTKGSEEARRGPKRRRIGDGTEMTNSFNPKYLTSRDLFELEVGIEIHVEATLEANAITNSFQVNDVAFRRHILVQSLILLDFVLSLTPKAKAKLADSTNKSVLYNYVLNDEDVSFPTISTNIHWNANYILGEMGVANENLHCHLFAARFRRQILLSNGGHCSHKRQELGSMESRSMSSNRAYPCFNPGLFGYAS